MDPTQRSELPPELERRLQELRSLDPDARTAALRELTSEYPLHAAAIAQFAGASLSQVATAGSDSAVIRARMARLQARGPANVDRYDVLDEIARGGMGAILRAFDQDLGRPLAMKVMLERGADGSRAAGDSQLLHRFVEEAQITGQLDHPGVVPVHELGLDASGRLYFTMRLVKGVTAEQVFERARRGEDGWTATRALEVLLKVCDTLAYAHSKGVVHRDLKPSNVMVGRYGEVYVMDWGLAKVLGQPDTHDVRIRPAPSTGVSRVRTDRSVEHESDPDSPLRTMDGAIVGTPCYMAPEQAHGRVEAIGAPADVYAVGAMLYTLLTGRQPYLDPGSPTSPYMVLEWVRNGPPQPVHQLDRAAPAELVAICERAMARDVDARYASMAALADDLRAFLENRVVRAYRTGARAELWSWVRRNRGMAAGLCAALLAVVLGGAGALVYARQAERAQQDAVREQRAADRSRQEAEGARGEAERTLAELREEQRRKAEVEERLERQRRRDEVLNRRNEQRASRLQELLERDAAVRQRSAALAAVDAQLRALAPAVAPSAVPAPDPSLDELVDRLLAPCADATTLAEWRGWARARLLLGSGHGESAGQALRAVAGSLQDDGFEWLVQRAFAEVHAAAGRWRDAIDCGAKVLGNAHSDGPERSADALACAEVVVRASFSALARQDVTKLQDLIGSGALSGGLQRLRGVLATTTGRLADGRRDLGELTDDETAWLPMLARNQRLAGEPALALATARRAGAEKGEPGLRAQAALEASLALAAAHRPHAALDLAFAARDALPARSIRAVEVHTALACSLLELARWDDALDSLSQALACTPAADDVLRRRLFDLVGRTLLQLGRHDDAIAAFAGVPAAESAGVAAAVPAGLPVVTLLGLSTAAERAGRPALADAAVALAAQAVGGGATPRDAVDGVDERAAVVEHRLSLRLGRGEIAASAAERAALGALRAGLAADAGAAHVRLAEALAAAGDPSAALAELEVASRATMAQLRDLARFLRDVPPFAGRQAAELGDTAIATLIRIAPRLASDHAEAAFRVLEAWRALPARMVLTGSMRAPAPDDGALAARYAVARAAAIEQAQRHPQAVPPVALDELEQQLRERAPARSGARFPRTPRLADLQQALPSDAALAVYAAAGGRTIAFVVTPERAVLVPLPDAPAPADALRGFVDAPDTARAERLAALGAALLEPVFAALAAGRAPRTLFVALPGAWSALPFELCTLAAPSGREPLIARSDVAYVPSATACFDQLLGLRRPGRDRARGALVAVHHGDADGSAAGWIAALLRSTLANFDGTTLARFSDRGGSDFASHGASLDLLGGARVDEAAIATRAAGRLAVVLALDLVCPPDAPEHAFLQCAAAGGDDFDGRLTTADLADLGLDGAVVLMQSTGSATDEVAAAGVLGDFVAAAWCGGARAVLTAAGAPPSAAAAELVAACGAALRRGEDPIAAFGAAWRRALADGSMPPTGPGVRLWSVR